MARTITTATGSQVRVGISGRFNGGERTVRLDSAPKVQLAPDDARRLGVALISSAADAERRGGSAS